MTQMQSHWIQFDILLVLCFRQAASPLFVVRPSPDVRGSLFRKVPLILRLGNQLERTLTKETQNFWYSAVSLMATSPNCIKMKSSLSLFLCLSGVESRCCSLRVPRTDFDCLYVTLTRYNYLVLSHHYIHIVLLCSVQPHCNINTFDLICSYKNSIK